MLRAAGGGYYESVRHIDDPKLKINSDHRENGAWDFTEYHKETKLAAATLDERLSRIEDVMGVGKPIEEKVEKETTKPQEVKYKSLRDQALELGIEFKGNPKRQWLEEKVAALS